MSEIVHERDTKRRRNKVRRLADLIQRSGVIDSWTSVFLAGSGMVSNRMGSDDVRQIVALRVVEQLSSLTPERLVRIKKPSGWLFLKCREAVRDASVSGSWTDMSGVGAAVTRQVKVGRAATDLRSKLGREPTTREVLAYANRGVEPTHWRYCTAEDVSGAPSAISIEGRSESGWAEPSVLPVARVEIADVYVRVLETVLPTGERSGPLRAWGATWLGCVAQGEPRPSVAMVAAELGVDDVSAARLHREWNRRMRAAADQVRRLLAA